MKISNSGYITKGIVLLISGILIGFFPSVITWIFYIIGGIVIVSSVFTLIGFSGDGSGGGIGLAGIIIGAIIMLIPKILTVGIAIVGGAIFTIYGISMLVKALRSDKSKNTRIIAIVFSILLTAFGIFMLVSPFKGGVFVRILTGVAMIVLALYNFYIAHVINERNKNSVSDTIDI
jgi:uncharacterized membrane protein HdeD (DUF308 family)